MKSRLSYAPFVAALIATGGLAVPAFAATSLSEPQVRELLGKQGYTRIDDLEFEDGMWETDATSADGNRVDLRVDASGKVYAEDVVSTFTAEDIEAKVTAAGYSKVHDVDYDDGVWKAEAERADGNNIEVRVDAKSGRILAVEND
ncbi:PepSY domain-containing protein [Pseudoxanthomonas sp. NC8]|nr:PepSY domain-containing protein [Pseudoxanthomonas sp. NC8]